MGEVEITRDGAVLTLTLNRPDVLNAINLAVHRGIADGLKQARDPDVRTVVITGAGRGFCVGQDLREFDEHPGSTGDMLRATYHPNVLAIRALEKPVIAAVNGPCAGAGVSLACACDLRIAAESASFVPGFVGIGLVPDAGGSFHVARLLGQARAFEWMTSNRKLSAEQAVDWGLVSTVVADADLPGPHGRAGSELRRGADEGDRDDEAPLRAGAARDARGAARARGSAPDGRNRDRGLRGGRNRLPREAPAAVQGPLSAGP